MKTVDAYIVVREKNPRGLKSYHRDKVQGKAILHHVIEKIQSIPSIRDTVIVCDLIDSFLEDSQKKYSLRLHNSTLEDIPRRARFRRCRLWSAAGWRGGIDYASAFDEDGWPSAFATIQEAHPCDYIYQVGAEWLCLDPQLSEKLIQYGMNISETTHIIFHQASPGFIGSLYKSDIIIKMAQKQWSLRDALAVKNTGIENNDEANGAGNHEVSTILSRNPWRFTADTSRQITWLEKLTKKNSELLKKNQAENWVQVAKEEPFIESIQREIEWEWTGENKSDFIDDELFQKISEELLKNEDMLISIDGRGSFLQHPQWYDYCRSLMQRRCHGLHLRCHIRDLNDKIVSKLLTSRASIISFVIDNDFNNEEACYFLENFCRSKNALSGPLAVVEMKRSENLIPSWEAFWDKWFGLADHVLWRYPTTYLGKDDVQQELLLNRRFRAPCRKLFHELIIRFDGTYPLCREDWQNKNCIGKYPEMSLLEATQKLQTLWKEQDKNNIKEPCIHCDAWDRLTA